MSQSVARTLSGAYWTNISCQLLTETIFQDDDTGLIHIQDSERKAVYDPFVGKGTILIYLVLSFDFCSPFTGSFLAPNVLNLQKYIHQPEMFLSYRINGNDPLNSPKRLQNTGNNTNKWASSFRLCLLYGSQLF